jgi:putative ABC transport system permease protein
MPDWNRIVGKRLAGLKLEPASEAEIIDELAQHVDDRYQELLAAGTPEPEAQRIALEPLNASPALVEALRRARSRTPPEPPARPSTLIAALLYDLRMSLRGMRQKPGFSFMVVGMLALGIAGNAAIFSTFNSLFLKPLPFAEPARLIDVDETAPRWNLHYVGISDPDFVAWRDHNTTFDGLAFFTQPDFNLSKAGPAQHIRAAKVTRGMLDVLGLKLVLGRNFLPEEDRPKSEKVALLGYDLWQRLFLADRNVLGRLIVLDNEPYKIVGVLPREAVFPDRAELWVPLAIDGNTANHGWYGHGIGRLKHGVSAQQAAADLLRIHRALIAAGRKVNEITSPLLTPLRARYLGDYRTASQVLLVAVGVVLLIACVNIAALMLVRSSMRSHEIAIRTAMGASRGRLIRQLLTENALLAAAGGLAGVLLGRLGLQAIVSLLPDNIPRWIDFHLDARFAAFAILITGAAALLFGLIPAWQGSRADMRSALHEAALRSSLSRGRRGTLNILVVSETALALALLISSGLLLRAFHRVTHIDPGFRPENVLTFSVDPPEQKYRKPEQVLAFYQSVVDRVGALPAVTAAGAASAPPLGGHWGQFFQAEGDRPLGPNEKTPVVLQVVVTPGYFNAIGMTVLAGRQFDAHDGESKDHPVAMVNETFARQHWPGGSPVGKRIRYNNWDSPWWEVVGLLHDEKHYGLDGEDRPAVYTPEAQLAFPMSLQVVVRSSANPDALAEPARKIVQGIDPDLPVWNVHTMTEQLDRSLWARRAYSWLLGVFSLVALVLAAAGIYGVISYAVSQRTQEIGIRIALGASPGEVLARVLRRGMVLVAAGSALGIGVTLAATGLLDKLLFGVSPRDPLVYGAVVAAVATVGLLANAIPARRAARLDPMRALRTE